MNNPTMERLSLMRLLAMAMAWEEQQKDAKMSKVAFDDRFGLLVDAEWTHRENRRITRVLKNAKLRINQACLEDIDYAENRRLDKTQLRQLASCRWIDGHQNVVIEGATGTGKTYVACALAQMACRRGYRAVYRRAPRLLDDLRLAKAAGEYARELKKLARFEVLVIDDWAIAPLKEPERQDVLEVLEDRHDVRSTIIASQLPANKWHGYIGDPTIADAICDRVLHNAHRIVLKGPSRRKKENGKNEE
jgi:DNA replication protein DnaC